MKKNVIADTGGIKEDKLINQDDDVIDLEKAKSISNIRIMKDNPNDIQDVLHLYRNFLVHKNNRILVVDDEEFCISAMKALLFKMGIDI